MKTAIIYCSIYRQHTKEIAEVFANRIGAVLIDVKDTFTIDIDQFDLIGFGSGIYQEEMATSLFRCVEKMNVMNKKVFVFSTSGMGMKFYNKALISHLQRKQALVVGSFACRGSFTSSDFTKTKLFDVFAFLAKNHPDEKDRDKARRFITEIVS